MRFPQEEGAGKLPIDVSPTETSQIPNSSIEESERPQVYEAGAEFVAADNDGDIERIKANGPKLTRAGAIAVAARRYGGHWRTHRLVTEEYGRYPDCYLGQRSRSLSSQARQAHNRRLYVGLEGALSNLGGVEYLGEVANSDTIERELNNKSATLSDEAQSLISLVAAQKAIVVFNIPLALARARLGVRSDFSLDSATQAAQEGLIAAVNRYGIYMGYAFSTYATWTIDGFIKDQRYQEWGLSASEAEALVPVVKYTDEFKDTYGRTPSHKEVAEAVNVPVGTVAAIRGKRQTVSLDARLQPHVEEDYSTRLDMLVAAPSASSIDDDSIAHKGISLDELLSSPQFDDRMRVFLGLQAEIHPRRMPANVKIEIAGESLGYDAVYAAFQKRYRELKRDSPGLQWSSAATDVLNLTQQQYIDLKKRAYGRARSAFDALSSQ